MEKKTLIANLKSTKKANVIKAGAKNEGTSSRKGVRRAEWRRAITIKMS